MLLLSVPQGIIYRCQSSLQVFVSSKVQVCPVGKGELQDFKDFQGCSLILCTRLNCCEVDITDYRVLAAQNKENISKLLQVVSSPDPCLTRSWTWCNYLQCCFSLSRGIWFCQLILCKNCEQCCWFAKFSFQTSPISNPYTCIPDNTIQYKSKKNNTFYTLGLMPVPRSPRMFWPTWRPGSKSSRSASARTAIPLALWMQVLRSWQWKRTRRSCPSNRLSSGMIGWCGLWIVMRYE